MSLILSAFNTVNLSIRKLSKLIQIFLCFVFFLNFVIVNRVSYSHFYSHASIECACQKAIKRPKKREKRTPSAGWRRGRKIWCEWESNAVDNNKKTLFYRMISEISDVSHLQKWKIWKISKPLNSYARRCYILMKSWTHSTPTSPIAR